MVSEPEGGTLGEMANLPIKSPVLQTLEKKNHDVYLHSDKQSF